MAQETERKFHTTNYHIAVIRNDEISPHYSHRLWLEGIGATATSIAQIAQYYLSLRLDENGEVVEEDRVRKKSVFDEKGVVKKVKFTRNSKFGYGLTREETPEEELEEDDFRSLIQKSQFLSSKTGKPPQVHKLRTTTEIGIRTLEIDRYLGPDLGGLCVTEIEFPSPEEATGFKSTELPRGILEKELDTKTFGNAQLALSSRIPDVITLPKYLRSS